MNLDYAEAPKEGYWPFLGAVANGLGLFEFSGFN
jgi:hypothetical protein